MYALVNCVNMYFIDMNYIEELLRKLAHAVTRFAGRRICHTYDIRVLGNFDAFSRFPWFGCEINEITKDLRKTKKN